MTTFVEVKKEKREKKKKLVNSESIIHSVFPRAFLSFKGDNPLVIIYSYRDGMTHKASKDNNKTLPLLNDLVLSLKMRHNSPNYKDV